MGEWNLRKNLKFYKVLSSILLPNIKADRGRLYLLSQV
jgi:hypothetical protein